MKSQIRVTYPSINHRAPRAYQRDVEAYINFFSDVNEQAELYRLDQAAMINHNITLINGDHKLNSIDFPNADSSVLCASVQRGAAVITYHVFVGPFMVIVKMLNIDNGININSGGTVLGKGEFGSILEQYDGNDHFVAKRIKFQRKLQMMKKPIDRMNWVLTATFSEVCQAIIEYSFAKVCSLLGIGPKIKTDIGFEMVCSRTYIEFYMQRCEQIGYRPKGVSVEAIQKRLRYCVAILHKYRLIHKDIKLTNIVYSHHRKDYVLCDFGISMPIQQPLGYLTKTYRQGTLTYMSPQMRALQQEGEGYVDLYYNDMYALQICQENMAQLIIKKEKDQIILIPKSDLLWTVKLTYQIYKGNTKNLCGQIITLKNSSLSQYFPELKGISPSNLHLNVEFLLAAIDISFELEEYLQFCDKNDPRIVVLVGKMKQICHNPSFVKTQYESTDFLERQHYEKRKIIRWQRQLRRLGPSQFLNPTQQLHKWNLLEKLIIEYLKNRTQILNVESMLTQFKKKRVHPNHDQIIRMTQICLRILDVQCMPSTEDLLKLVQGCPTKLFFIGKCLMDQADSNNAFLIFLKISDENLLEIMSYIWICYLQISQELRLDPKTLEKELLSIDSKTQTWKWVRQVSLLALSHIMDRPQESVAVLQREVEKVQNEYQLVIVKNLRYAYTALSNPKAATYWFGRYVQLLKKTEGPVQSVFCLTEEIILCQSQIITFNQREPLTRMCQLLETFRVKASNQKIVIADLELRVAQCFARLNLYAEARSYMSENNYALFRNHFDSDALVKYLYKKCVILDNEASMQKDIQKKWDIRREIISLMSEPLRILQKYTNFSKGKTQIYVFVALQLLYLEKPQQSEALMRKFSVDQIIVSKSIYNDLLIFYQELLTQYLKRKDKIQVLRVLGELISLEIPKSLKTTYQQLLVTKKCIIIKWYIHLGLQQQLTQILKQLEITVDFTQKSIQQLLQKLACDEYELLNFECADIYFRLHKGELSLRGKLAKGGLFKQVGRLEEGLHELFDLQKILDNQADKQNRQIRALHTQCCMQICLILKKTKKLQKIKIQASIGRDLVQKALKEDSQNYDLHYKLGMFLRYLGQHKESSQSLQRAVALSMKNLKPIHPEMAYEAAVGNFLIGKHRKALFYLQKLNQPVAIQLACECFVGLRKYKSITYSVISLISLNQDRYIKWIVDYFLIKSRWTQLYLLLPETIKSNSDYLPYKVFEAVYSIQLFNKYNSIEKRLQVIIFLKHIQRTAMHINQLNKTKVENIQLSVIRHAMNLLKSNAPL